MIRSGMAAVLALAMLHVVQAGAEDPHTTEIDGVWALINYVENGVPNREDIEADFRVTRKNEIQRITKAGKPFSRSSLRVDSRKIPKEIDFIDERGTRVRGVYEITDGTMRVAIIADAEKRKTERPADL